MNPLFRLDVLSENSRYREHPIGEKLLFSLGTLLLALIMKPFPFALLASFSLILFLFRSGVRPADFATLLLIPSAFLFSAVLPLLVELDIATSPFIGQLSFDAMHLRFSQAGLHRAGDAVLRSITALLSVYALTATTPMPRILASLRGRGMPEVLLDILYFSHRMIHLFMESAHVVARAQRARGGERNFPVRFRSRVILWHRLYDRVRERVLRMERALLSRGYRGELRFLSAPAKRSTMSGILQILFFQAILVVASLALPLLAGDA